MKETRIMRDHLAIMVIPPSWRGKDQPEAQACCLFRMEPDLCPREEAVRKLGEKLSVDPAMVQKALILTTMSREDFMKLSATEQGQDSLFRLAEVTPLVMAVYTSESEITRID